MWPCVSICVGISGCVNMNKAEQLEVSCSTTCFVHSTAEKDTETCHGAIGS